MIYNSTRGSLDNFSFEQAVIKGIASDGGLFVPDDFPVLCEHDMDMFGEASYKECAANIINRFIPSFNNGEIRECVNAAYGENFDSIDVAPLKRVKNGVYSLELWHGPTAAFKDMALQLTPRLLVTSLKKTQSDKNVAILVATSGDTGKAALEGFCDVPKTKIMVIYPQNGVSEVQKRQMITQEGGNVKVVAIKGNFDDAQTAVKGLFADSELAENAYALGYTFSSANSINWGRLLPQIVYYIRTCAKLRTNGILTGDKKATFVVPTGNFGNILSCFYAKKMGAPIGRIICASNENNILTDFINTGVYDRNREFYKTLSPSMDILISSNLERLLYEISGHNSEAVCGWMKDLKETGKYSVDSETLKKIQENFLAGSLDDEQTKKEIKRVFDEDAYLIDTHTAVAFGVYENIKASLSPDDVSIIVSTASPYKFASSVLEAITGRAVNEADCFKALPTLSELTKTPVPMPLMNIEGRPILQNDTSEVGGLKRAVLDFLK